MSTACLPMTGDMCDAVTAASKNLLTFGSEVSCDGNCSEQPYCGHNSKKNET